MTTIGWLLAMPEIDHAGVASKLTIALDDGRHFEGRAENGMLEPGEMEDKFRRRTRRAIGGRRSSSGCSGSRTRRT